MHLYAYKYYKIKTQKSLSVNMYIKLSKNKSKSNKSNKEFRGAWKHKYLFHIVCFTTHCLLYMLFIQCMVTLSPPAALVTDDSTEEETVLAVVTWVVFSVPAS